MLIWSGAILVWISSHPLFRHSAQLVVRRCQSSIKNIIKHTLDLHSDKELWGKGYVATTSLDLLPQMIERLLNNQSSDSTGDGK